MFGSSATGSFPPVFKRFSLAQKKVALTSFWVSKHIGFEDLNGTAGMIAAIASLSEDSNFNLQPVLDNFYNTFTKDYAKQFPFELMDEKDVIETEAYQNYETRWGEGDDKDRSLLFQRYLTAEGYKPMMESLRNKGEKSNTKERRSWSKTHRKKTAAKSHT